MPNRRLISRSLHALSLGAAVLFAPLVLAAPPGAVGVAEEAVISGRIVSIDPESQAVLVQGPRGNVVELIGGDEVKNFKQIKKGDMVTLTRAAAVVTALEPVDSKDTPLAESVERTARAGEGAKPGFAREITTTVTAQITKVDAKKRTVTFRGPRETLRTVKIQDPNIDLSKITAGRMAKLVYREVVSIVVTSPPKA
ncbi:hypothetical protein [Cupriavidus basilensis]|uniref:hypothetical protein n=1 Tax=Cupriavidus basilensis TaxID=68895 RepID=UPI001ED90A60|nr:hypothetical protein [Cupriavidus basilensis]